VVGADPRCERLATGCGFTADPAWRAGGRSPVFSDISGDRLIDNAL
jgi:hypothetical protein